MYRSFVVFLLIPCLGAAVLAGTDSQQAVTPLVVSANSYPQADLMHTRAKQYKAALLKNPNDAVSHNMLGVCYQSTGQLTAAIKEYQQAIKLDKQYAEAWNNLGSTYHGKRKLKQAVKYYTRAIELKPSLAPPHKNLGTALLQQGKIEAGIAEYRRAFELNRDIFVATTEASFGIQGSDMAMQYFYFAKLNAASGRIDEALGFLKKARSMGFRNFAKVRRDPDFKNVVADARFASLTK
jgi:tetratricopeptide (TPR) repeat protein